MIVTSVGAHRWLTGTLDGEILRVAGVGLAIMCVDFALIYWRVRNGIYGDNRLEAEELLTFMTRRDNDPAHHGVPLAILVEYMKLRRLRQLKLQPGVEP